MWPAEVSPRNRRKPYFESFLRLNPSTIYGLTLHFFVWTLSTTNFTTFDRFEDFRNWLKRFSRLKKSQLPRNLKSKWLANHMATSRIESIHADPCALRFLELNLDQKSERQCDRVKRGGWYSNLF